jgi:NDP-sugar pyrophosphorylase family protein
MIPIAILAGGLAKRLGALTQNTPKSLVPINGKPFVHWQLELLAQKGLTKVVFCVSHMSDMIQDYVGNGSKFNLEVSYVQDGSKQLGTGGAIKKAIPSLGEKFMVLYGDSYLNLNYFAAEQAFLKSTKKAMMTIYKNNNVVIFCSFIYLFALHEVPCRKVFFCHVEPSFFLGQVETDVGQGPRFLCEKM